MLKFVILAVVATLCISQDLGDHDYIACDDCRIPDGEFPKEGEMVCFHMIRESVSVEGMVQTCVYLECDPFDFFCVPTKKCYLERGNISVSQCKLERKGRYKPIEQLARTNEMDIYQIHSPHYFIHDNYPNNTYCVWNVADTGFVTYHIMDQQLQEPVTKGCDGPGCDCPDSVKMMMGNTEIKLCGSNVPSMNYLASFDGLHVKFCSDNKHTAKGINIVVNKFSDVEILYRREAKQWQNSSDTSDSEFNSTEEFDNATCQYEYMIRMSQPDVPCPDNHTILSMLQQHNHLMVVSKENEGMCEEMQYPTSMNSMMMSMNKIEMCAVEYLYRTGDCRFAKKVATATNKELSGVARAILKNIFFKKPKRMHLKDTKCTEDDN